MDLKRWIYSPDLARWLSAGRELDLDERMDCILSAPHRTLEEKLDGLREPRREAEGESILSGSRSERRQTDMRQKQTVFSESCVNFAEEASGIWNWNGTSS